MKLLKILCLAASTAAATSAFAGNMLPAGNNNDRKKEPCLKNITCNIVPAWGNEPLETDTRVISYIRHKNILCTQSK